MQPDYLKNIVLKWQVDRMQTQGEISLRFVDIENRKTRKNRRKLSMFRHSPNIIAKWSYFANTQGTIAKI